MKNLYNYELEVLAIASHVFHIRSFIPDVSIASLQVHCYSEVLPCSTDTVPKNYRHLRVKDLPKVPTWQLGWVLNLQPSGRKALNLPLNHHAPQFAYCSNWSRLMTSEVCQLHKGKTTVGHIIVWPVVTCDLFFLLGTMSLSWFQMCIHQNLKGGWTTNQNSFQTGELENHLTGIVVFCVFFFIIHQVPIFKQLQEHFKVVL